MPDNTPSRKPIRTSFKLVLLMTIPLLFVFPYILAPSLFFPDIHGILLKPTYKQYMPAFFIVYLLLAFPTIREDNSLKISVALFAGFLLFALGIYSNGIPLMSYLIKKEPAEFKSTISSIDSSPSIRSNCVSEIIVDLDTMLHSRICVSRQQAENLKVGDSVRLSCTHNSLAVFVNRIN